MLAKRLFDIAAVCLGLTVLAPLMFIVAIVVKTTSKGPIFFLQERVGWQESKFLLYKFRTMVDRAEAMGTSVTTSDDLRITTVGRKLRRMKLDELPQLINVLKGDMSLVGPRPDVPEIVEKYSASMRRIFAILPGLTSVATLHLRDEERLLAHVPDPDRFYEDILVPLKVELAMEHVDRKSLAFDLKVLCMTVWMMTIGKWLPIREHPAISVLKKEIKNIQLSTNIH
jgi:lipopolysaccharide/colanic/teichoic acid biosynthesis glycosyltransferase